MATVITQDRQIASLVPPVGKNRIVVSVKSKAGAGLYIESHQGAKQRVGSTVPTSTASR